MSEMVDRRVWSSREDKIRRLSASVEVLLVQEKLMGSRQPETNLFFIDRAGLLTVKPVDGVIFWMAAYAFGTIFGERGEERNNLIRSHQRVIRKGNK